MGQWLEKVKTAITLSASEDDLISQEAPGHPVCWSRAQAGNGEGHAFWPRNAALVCQEASPTLTGQKTTSSICSLGSLS